MMDTNAGTDRFQFSLRSLFVVTTLCAILIGSCSYAVRSFDESFGRMLVGETGPVESIDDWPRPLRELLADAEPSKAESAEIQVYCLCQGFDPEYVWSMPNAPGVFDRLVNRWGLSRVANPKWRVLQGASSLSGVRTPQWWDPSQNPNTEFYECKTSLAREKGDRFCVALDKNRNIVFVHYWFNF